MVGDWARSTPGRTVPINECEQLGWAFVTVGTAWRHAYTR
jgi:hypothetical protein